MSVQGMENKERNAIILVLALVTIMVAADLITDSKEAGFTWHLIIEAFIGLLSLAGIFFLLKDSYNLQKKLTASQNENSKLKEEANQWKQETQKFIQGLAKSIDDQLTKWDLTPAEKEVALLLLKGLSIKEISEVRQTAEKTARTQTISIYAKSGLNGRSELAAFFLEDLLHPQVGGASQAKALGPHENSTHQN